MMNQAPRVFNRIGAVRGIAGAWKEEAPQFYPTEALAGESKAITITANDYRDLQYPITPTTLLQKLVRTVEMKPMSRMAIEEYDLLLNFATNSPTVLVNYTKAGNNVYIPEDVVEPVVEPVIEATFSPWTPPVQETVVEPVAPLVIHVEQTESEPVMEMAFQSLAPTSGAEAVLVVPDVQPYFPREFEGVSEETIYDYARKTQQNVLLTGDAGTGKTSSARNYAAKNGLPFVTVECTQQIDQSITQGRFIPTGVGNSVAWKYSQLATAIQRPAVILINELTRMTPKAASLFLRLLQERELLIEPLNEVIKVHPDAIFIADQNTGVGYVGTSKQDNALVDRFNLKLEFHYDSKIESKFIKSPALLEFATSIRQAAEQNDQFSVPMSTRALINFQAQASHLGFVFAANSLLNNFPKSDGEREAIKMRFDADSLTIASELGVDYANYNSK
jgi:MoxR-like ATPase